MSRKLDWQTEDDQDLTKPWSQPAETEKQSSPSRRWLTFAIFFFLAAGLTLLAVNRLQQQVEETTELVRQDVLSSHELIQQAARQEDDELFFTLLSGRQPAWTRAQRELFDNGYLFERQFAGLQMAAPPEVVDISLTPNLQEAEVTSRYRYAYVGAGGAGQSVVLDQIAIYRLGAERWLLSPPDEAFWGEEQVWRGQRVIVKHPERDAALAEALGQQLDDALHAVCQKILDCTIRPVNRPMTVHLDADASLFARMAGFPPERDWNPQLLLTLPTPSLFGLPADESSRAALLNAYAIPVLQAYLIEAGLSCCRGGLLYRALLDRQLERLGLIQWPLSDDHYAQLHQEGVRLADGVELWSPITAYQEMPENWPLAYAMIDFLLSIQPERSVSLHHAWLIRSPGYHAWLQGFEMHLDETEYAGLSLEAAWSRYLYERAPAGQSAPPAAWPEQSLLALCAPPAGPPTLYRLNTPDREWTALTEDRRLVASTCLPIASRRAS